MSQAVMSRVAVLTGASSGIGRELAKELAREGYRIGLVARRREELEKLAGELREAGGVADIEVADVADRQTLVSAIERLAERLGPVDLLVANAGLGTPTRLDPMNVEEIEQVIRVNLLGVVYALEAVLPAMLKRGSGHIAATASLAAYKGFPGQAAYCASKAAVMRFLESLRIELRGTGIHVTTICPGFVRTPMTAAHPFRMPFLLDADEAARRVARALRRRKKVFNFPWQTERLVKLCYWIPDWIMARVAKKRYSFDNDPPAAVIRSGGPV
jgi:short-subunit dehydrogenase